MADIVLTPAQSRMLSKAVATLNEVLHQLQLENPDCNINWYLESGALHLMGGDSHDDDGRARQDLVIETFTLDKADGGGW
ncbi:MULTISPECIES: hypothetical protein [Aeromonas]|uniref:hypothetical protein n=1 Tax=Aeromonas TaxID=642 RepID=UPI002B0580F7|nr:hypothetical protein [Aeromonas jandaei]